MTQLDRQPNLTEPQVSPEIAAPKRGRRQWQWLNNFLDLFPTVGLSTVELCIGLAVLSPIALPDPADPFATPEHLLPEWYLLPVDQLVRLIPYKIVGIVTMVAFATGLLLLPIIENLIWFDPRLRRGVSIALALRLVMG